MNKLKKKKAGIKDFFKGKHGRNFLLALDVLLAIAFFAQPDLYYNPQAPDFFDRFYADSLIICGGLWAVLVFLTVKKIHFSAEGRRGGRVCTSSNVYSSKHKPFCNNA